MITFLDSYFGATTRRTKPLSKPQKRSEYHGVATAVGKISKRLHTLEKLSTTGIPIAIPTTPDIIEDEVVTKPIKLPGITPSPVVTVTETAPKEEGKDIVKDSRSV